MNDGPAEVAAREWCTGMNSGSEIGAGAGVKVCCRGGAGLNGAGAGAGAGAKVCCCGGAGLNGAGAGVKVC